MGGSFRRLLHVDLTTGRSEHRAIDESRLRDYVGGIGLGMSLLWEYTTAGIDALSPSNPLVFASAPLAGVRLELDDRSAVTDETGRFLLVNDALQTGWHELWIDGRQAKARATFGTLSPG